MKAKSALTIFTCKDGEYLPTYDYTFEFGAKQDAQRRVNVNAPSGSIIQTTHATFDEWLDDNGKFIIGLTLPFGGIISHIVEQPNYNLNTGEPVGDDECLYGASQYSVDKSI